MADRWEPITGGGRSQDLQKCPGGGRSQHRAPPTTTPNRRSLRMRVTLTWNQPIPTQVIKRLIGQLMDGENNDVSITNVRHPSFTIHAEVCLWNRCQRLPDEKRNPSWMTLMRALITKLWARDRHLTWTSWMSPTRR
ncbi:uncharacterized protein LOC143962481 isoform X2 [Lithobates pipiens]